MCQGPTRRLSNLSERCHVRKIARLLAQPLRASANRRVSYVSSDDTKAFPSRRGLSSAKSCQPIGGASKLSSTPTARRRPRPEELGTLAQAVLYFRAATFKNSEGNNVQLYEPPKTQLSAISLQRSARSREGEYN